MKFDSSNPDFQRLLQAFNALTHSREVEEAAVSLVRIAATSSKEILDGSLEQFSKPLLRQATKDLYAKLNSEKLADKIAGAVQAIDEEKIKDVVDGIEAQMKDPVVSVQIAKQVQNILNKTPMDEIEAKLSGMMEGRSFQEQMMFQAIFMQAAPILEAMKTSDVKDVAQMISQIASSIPSDLVAAQLAALAQQAAPEMVTKQVENLVDQLPTPNAVANVVHGAGKAVSKRLDQAAKAATPAEAVSIFQHIAADISKVVTKTIANDQAAKNKPRRKKGPGSIDL